MAILMATRPFAGSVAVQSAAERGGDNLKNKNAFCRKLGPDAGPRTRFQNLVPIPESGPDYILESSPDCFTCAEFARQRTGPPRGCRVSEKHSSGHSLLFITLQPKVE